MDMEMEMNKCLNVSDLCILLLDHTSLKRLPILGLAMETISDFLPM